MLEKLKRIKERIFGLSKEDRERFFRYLFREDRIRQEIKELEKSKDFQIFLHSSLLSHHKRHISAKNYEEANTLMKSVRHTTKMIEEFDEAIRIKKEEMKAPRERAFYHY